MKSRGNRRLGGSFVGFYRRQDCHDNVKAAAVELKVSQGIRLVEARENPSAVAGRVGRRQDRFLIAINEALYEENKISRCGRTESAFLAAAGRLP